MNANGFNTGMGNGYYTYGVARPAAKNTQPLTNEQIQQLRSKPEGFDMKVTQPDLWRAACTHKEKDSGVSTLVPAGTETVTDKDGNVIRTKDMWQCTICGEKFEIPADFDTKAVSNTLDDMLSYLQTCKTIYLDAPEDVISQYFQLIALLKKFEALWKVSVRNFERYSNDDGSYPAHIGYGLSNGFNTLNSILSNPWGASFQQPAPMMQPQYNPYQPAAPVMQQPQYMAAPIPMDPNANPLAYGYAPAAPMAPAAAPVAPAPGMMPPAAPMAPAAAPVAPAPGVATAPADGTEVQQQKTWNV